MRAKRRGKEEEEEKRKRRKRRGSRANCRRNYEFRVTGQRQQGQPQGQHCSQTPWCK